MLPDVPRPLPISVFFLGKRYISKALLAFKTYTFWTTFGAFWTSGGCTLRKVLILERLDLRWMHVIERFGLRRMHVIQKLQQIPLFFSSSPAAQPKKLRPSPSYSFFPVDFSSNSVLEKDRSVWRFQNSFKNQNAHFLDDLVNYIGWKKHCL